MEKLGNWICNPLLVYLFRYTDMRSISQTAIQQNYVIIRQPKRADHLKVHEK